MTTTRRSFIKRAAILLLGVAAAPRLAAGAAEAIPFRVVRTVLLRPPKLPSNHRTPEENERLLACVDLLKGALQQRFMRHYSELVRSWRLPRTGLLLERLDTSEYGVVTCDKREALLVAFCHDSVTMEVPKVQPDPALVESWHASEAAAIKDAGGIYVYVDIDAPFEMRLPADATFLDSWEG